MNKEIERNFLEINSLSDLFYLEVGFDTGGTRLTYYDQTKV